MNRRIPALVLAGLSVIGVVVWARHSVEPVVPVFATVEPGWMPAAPVPGAVTESWFCPGAPASGDEEQARVDIVNRTADPLSGKAMLANDAGQKVEVPVSVPGWGRQSIDVDATLTGAVVSTFVDIPNGGAVVEQYSQLKSGNSLLVCTTQAAKRWYFADGYTVGESSDRIVIANPYDYPAVASVVYSVSQSFVQSGSHLFSGIQIPAQGVRVVELATPGSGAQGEPRIGVTVKVTRGRVVVGRIQNYTDERAGQQVTLGSSESRDQWWFPGTIKAADTTQQFSLYNPTDEDVQADVIVLGSEAQPDAIDLPPQSVASFDLASVTDLAEGVYTMVISTTDGQSLVVERATTTRSDGRTGTSVLMGAPPREDGFIASAWIVGVTPSEATTSALYVHNVDLSDGAFTVYAVTPTGAVPIPNLDALPIAGGASMSIDLNAANALGQQVVVVSTTRILVERSLPSGRGDMRTNAWAVPVLPLPAASPAPASAASPATSPPASSVTAPASGSTPTTGP